MYKTSNTIIDTNTFLKTSYGKTVLDNGLRIVTEHLPYIKSISIGFWINVGSRDELEENNGISHFLEHMVFKGTRDFSAKQIALQIEGFGGYINAFTGKETTSYYVKILDDQLKRAVDVLSQLVLYPLLRKNDIEKEKFVVLEEIKNIEDDPEDLIHDVFDKNLFLNNSVGYPVIGNSENVLKFTRQDLIEHLKKFYNPENMVIAAAGNINHNKFVDLIATYFLNKDFTRINRIQNRIKPKESTNNVIKIEKPIQQTHICTGTKSYSIKSKYRFALTLMNTLLGEGMSSRLFQNIREKYGFTYSIGSFLNYFEDTGSFGVYAGTDKKHVETTLNLINKELEKIKKYPISQSELSRVKAQVKGTMMLSLENMSTRMMRLATNEIYFNDYFSIESLIEKVDLVSAEEIQAVANRIIDINNFTTVIFSPTI